MSVNKVILIGNVGQDPDIKYLPNGDNVANFSIATSEQWNDRQTGERREKTEWHRIVAFRKAAEIIGQYCRKGSKIYIEGKLQTRSWQDQSGQTRYITEIVVETFHLLSSRQNNYENNGGYDGPQQERGLKTPFPVQKNAEHPQAGAHRYGGNNYHDYGAYNNNNNYGSSGYNNYGNMDENFNDNNSSETSTNKNNNNGLSSSGFEEDSDVPF